MPTFQSYVDRHKVKTKTSDPEEASSLLEKARQRLKFTENAKLDDESAPFVFEDAYLAAREAAQSLMSTAGYKPYSHEATIVFVKEKHSEILDEEKASEFDRLRQLRADSEYRAITVSIKEAEDCVSFAKEFIEKVQGLSEEKKS